jgi:hypothetical protein
MSQQRYTIVIDADGTLAGASLHDGNLDAQPLDLKALAKVVPKINDAALAKVDQHAAEVAAIKATHSDELAFRKMEHDKVTAERDALETLRQTMTGKVRAALETGDVAKFFELGVEFLTPEDEKIRAGKLAKLAELKAELGLA